MASSFLSLLNFPALANTHLQPSRLVVTGLEVEFKALLLWTLCSTPLLVLATSKCNRDVYINFETVKLVFGFFYQASKSVIIKVLFLSQWPCQPFSQIIFSHYFYISQIFVSLRSFINFPPLQFFTQYHCHSTLDILFSAVATLTALLEVVAPKNCNFVNKDCYYYLTAKYDHFF